MPLFSDPLSSSWPFPFSQSFDWLLLSSSLFWKSIPRIIKNHQVYTKYPSTRAKVILRFRRQAPLLLSICILQWGLPLFGPVQISFELLQCALQAEWWISSKHELHKHKHPGMGTVSNMQRATNMLKIAGLQYTQNKQPEMGKVSNMPGSPRGRFSQNFSKMSPEILVEF